MDAHTETRYHVHGQAQPDDAGKRSAVKAACYVCAVRRSEIFLLQTGRTREVFLSETDVTFCAGMNAGPVHSLNVKEDQRGQIKG